MSGDAEEAGVAAGQIESRASCGDCARIFGAEAGDVDDGYGAHVFHVATDPGPGFLTVRQILSRRWTSPRRPPSKRFVPRLGGGCKPTCRRSRCPASTPRKASVCTA